MFLIFKIIPDWIWWFLLLSGLIGLFISYLPQVKTYELLIKSFAYTIIAATIFTLGMLYCENTWKQAASELQSKINVMAAESKVVNDVIKEKTTTQIQIVRIRGEDVVKYIDREVVKHDNTCVIPQTFVDVHNRAAEVPK
jgi:hypothetical protein